ncbi:MAG TPA: hypothetical protein PKE00_12830, partial [Planctomycetota bacterium]|nr:hypothetical protein [Planctomycetota bacterium]
MHRATAIFACTLLALGWLMPVGARAQGERTVDFRLDVVPLLERKSCSTAACHGGATGRGGFKLSLFGSDPLADYRAIALEGAGRRIDVAEPEASLVLRKATKRYDHGGGRVLRRDEPAYAMLRAWIAAGAPPPCDERPLVRLRLQLDAARLEAFAIVEGREERVTDRAHFFSSDDAVVRVLDEGASCKVEVREPGEHWVFARYAGALARLRLVRPFDAA